MRFFIGLHQPSDAIKVWRENVPAFISVNRIRKRKSNFLVGDWIMDSGAFSTILQHGGYPHPVGEYADQIRRWKSCGNLLSAVAQDYMCEPHMLDITGLSIADHQRLTIERYDALIAENTGVYIIPVLQGYLSDEYVSHIRQYGGRLKKNAWVGVGSICKRNGDPKAVERVLLAIQQERPDLKLHGFGLKSTALGSSLVRALLYSADSMAWSFAERKNGGNANDWRAAVRYANSVTTSAYQIPLFLGFHYETLRQNRNKTVF